MKALIITIDKYPHRGGKSTHISNLIFGLKELGVECEVCSGDFISPIMNNFLKLLVYVIKFISKKHYMYYRKRIEVFLFKKTLKSFIKNKKYDFVSFQDAITCGTCGDLFKKSFLTMHTYFGIEYTLDNSGLRLDDELYKKLLKLEEKSIEYASSIISVDERIKEHVLETEEKIGINKPVFSICNSTNTEIFKPSNKTSGRNRQIIIGCVRRLVEKNGVIFAVMAMKYLDDYNCVLKIYGEGPCEEEIRKYIKDEKLNEKVELCGGIDNDKIANAYKNMDIVVVPSITKNGLQEATSISAIESMACGIPTIASNIGGLPLLIKDGENGMLVPEQSPKEIADSIIELIENKEEFNSISKAAREFIVKNHSHVKAANEYLNIFKS